MIDLQSRINSFTHRSFKHSGGLLIKICVVFLFKIDKYKNTLPLLERYYQNVILYVTKVCLLC